MYSMQKNWIRLSLFQLLYISTEMNSCKIVSSDRARKNESKGFTFAYLHLLDGTGCSGPSTSEGTFLGAKNLDLRERRQEKKEPEKRETRNKTAHFPSRPFIIMQKTLRRYATKRNLCEIIFEKFLCCIFVTRGLYFANVKTFGSQPKWNHREIKCHRHCYAMRYDTME